jgi:hypothetical protein
LILDTATWKAVAHVPPTGGFLLVPRAHAVFRRLTMLLCDVEAESAVIGASGDPDAASMRREIA